MKDQYFLYPCLPYKVEEYIKEHGNRAPNVEAMTEFLIENHKIFHNKKKKIFIKSVAKAYDTIKPKFNFESTSESSKDIIEVKSSTEVGVEECREFSIESLYANSNLMSKLSKQENSNYSPTRVKGFANTPKHKSVDSPKQQQAIETNLIPGSTKKEEKEIICLGNVKKIMETCVSNSNGNLSTIVSKKKRKKISLSTNDQMNYQDVKKVKKMKFETCIPSGSLFDMEGIDFGTFEMLINLGTKNLTKKCVEKESKCKSVLLSGPEGSGKSLLISGFAGDFQSNLLKISAIKFQSGNANESSCEEKIDSVFKQALASVPCVLHIDDLHVLAKPMGVNAVADGKIIYYLVKKINDVIKNFSGMQIFIFGELRYQHSKFLDENLLGIFQKEIYMPGLNTKNRLSLLQKIFPSLNHNDLEDIAKRTPSFVAGDLKKLASEVETYSEYRANSDLVRNLTRSTVIQECNDQYDLENKYLKEDIEAVLKLIKPTLKKVGFPFIPEVKMDDIGGMEDVKMEIRKKILRPIQQSERYQMFGMPPLNGILLYGPPGCGKTLLAKAIANEAGLNFLPVNSTEMLKMYQGESERTIRENFRLAASVKPCIIFFDEFDTIASTRTGGSESGSRQTIVNTLLYEMDGIINREGVYIMACTNRPDIIDTALLRPGRLGTKLYVGIPDAEGRRRILLATTKNGTQPRIAAGVDLTEISSKCQNFTGADLVNLIHVAKERAFDRPDEVGVDGRTLEFSSLNKEDFEYACSNVVPSLTPQEIKKYTKIRNEFEYYTIPRKRKLEEQSEAVANDEVLC